MTPRRRMKTPGLYRSYLRTRRVTTKYFLHLEPQLLVLSLVGVNMEMT